MMCVCSEHIYLRRHKLYIHPDPLRTILYIQHEHNIKYITFSKCFTHHQASGIVRRFILSCVLILSIIRSRVLQIVRGSFIMVRPMNAICVIKVRRGSSVVRANKKKNVRDSRMCLRYHNFILQCACVSVIFIG